MKNYDNGYRVGNLSGWNKLEEAYEIVKQTKQNFGVVIGRNHLKSVDPCRVLWVEGYEEQILGVCDPIHHLSP